MVHSSQHDWLELFDKKASRLAITYLINPAALHDVVVHLNVLTEEFHLVLHVPEETSNKGG